MITGYNTDVRHKDIVLHVQTEDKGVSNPQIESLIYIGGQVLVAKRASYADLLEEGKGEEAISELMDHQHRVMIRAIRAGKFDSKLEALIVTAASAEASGQGQEVEGGLLERTREEAGPTLDQVILDYLTTEAREERLQLSMDEETSLRAGELSVIEVRASSSKNGVPVGGASVTVKMISTVREPRLLARGHTDEEGYLRLEFDIPPVEGGAAALIIAAASVIGSAELKHLL